MPLDSDGFSGGRVRTDSLVDDNDSSAWETLREAGYETGDYVLVDSCRSVSGGPATSTSFTITAGFGDRGIIDTDGWPSGAQLYLAYAVRLEGDATAAEVYPDFDQASPETFSVTADPSASGAAGAVASLAPTAFDDTGVSDGSLVKWNLRVNSGGGGSVTIKQNPEVKILAQL